MKALTLGLALVVATVPAPALAGGPWAKVIDASDHDDGYALDLTADGGYIVSGYTDPNQDGNRDFWLLKLNADGVVEWQRSYGTSCPCDWAWSVRQTTDGGYIVAGYTCFCSRGFDFWVLKLDADGQPLWQNTYGGLESDNATAVVETFDAQGHPSGYLVGGWTWSFGMGDRDVLLLKLNLDGSVAWQRTYGGAGADWLGAVEQTADGGYIVAATSASFSAAQDFWVLKLSPDGTPVWQRTYGGADHEKANAVQQTLDAAGQPNGYVVAGDSWSFTSGRGADAWVLRLRMDGSVVWQMGYGGDTGDGAEAVRQTFDASGSPSGFIVGGPLSAVDGGINSNAWLLRLSNDGSVAGMSHYGGCGDVGMSGFELVRSLRQTTDGGFVAVGYSQDATTAQRDLLLLKVRADGSLPFCGLVSGANEVAVTATNATALATSAAGMTAAATSEATSVTPIDTAGATTTTCQGRPSLQRQPGFDVYPSQSIIVVGSTITLAVRPSPVRTGDDEIQRYEWDLDGDGRYVDGWGAALAHAWAAPGRYTVAVRAVFLSGATLVTTRTLVVNGVSIDVAPEAFPAGLGDARDGFLSVVVHGLDDFNVREIDPGSLSLLGVPVSAWSIEDVATPPSRLGRVVPGANAPDGVDDLVLWAKTRSVLQAVTASSTRSLPDGETVTLTLTGALADGTRIQGEDAAVVSAAVTP